LFRPADDSCALASIVLACATPFAAFAVISAAMLPPRLAFLVVAGTWLVNQAIGFGVHHYPIDTYTILWGFAMGAGAVASVAVSVAALCILPLNRTPLVLALTLVCADSACELVLFAVTPFVGGAGAFTTSIVARLGALNGVWLISLFALSEIIRLVNSFRRDRAVPT
jgi:hypothetical protein